MSTVLSKDVINLKNTHVLGARIKSIWQDFNLVAFDQEIKSNILNKGLGERIQLVRKTLYEYLPKNYKLALSILLKSLPNIIKSDAFDNKLDLSSQNGFIMISVTSFVARYGIDEYELSMNALKEMTKRFSAEGSIRYFIIKYPRRVIKTFKKWVNDESPHVRRLVSESTRPRLPMTMALPIFKNDPSPIIPFLEKLKYDQNLFIRRSVANNLNDISKDNPDVVVKLLKKWNLNNSKEMKWVIKHSLRTLEKKGNAEALQILGFSTDLKVTVNKFRIKNRKIKLGESINMDLEICTDSYREELILIDYIVYHMKANKKLSPKIFKWTKKKIPIKKPLSLSKTHFIKKISTRRYYAGVHEIHIQINGKIVAEAKFELTV